MWAVYVGRVPLPAMRTRARCAGGHVGGRATLCLPAVRGRVCVGSWAGEVSVYGKSTLGMLVVKLVEL